MEHFFLGWVCELHCRTSFVELWAPVVSGVFLASWSATRSWPHSPSVCWGACVTVHVCCRWLSLQLFIAANAFVLSTEWGFIATYTSVACQLFSRGLEDVPPLTSYVLGPAGSRSHPCLCSSVCDVSVSSGCFPGVLVITSGKAIWLSGTLVSCSSGSLCLGIIELLGCVGLLFSSSCFFRYSSCCPPAFSFLALGAPVTEMLGGLELSHSWLKLLLAFSAVCTAWPCWSFPVRLRCHLLLFVLETNLEVEVMLKLVNRKGFLM